MSGDSQASFSASVKNKIRETYQYRCVICLVWIETTQCAHLLDAATPQLRAAVKLGVLDEGYKRNAQMNGFVQCPNCHSLFTKNRVVLSLPIPVLRYLDEYISSTPKGGQKPLYQVFDLLVDALNGKRVKLPDTTAILPYLGLFTLVTLDPTAAARNIMTTPYLPSLSIIQNNKFEEAPPNASATDMNVARIFDPLSIADDTPFSYGRIPLAPGVATFEEERYWRIPISTGAVFAALMARTAHDLSECVDIELAKRIVDYLMVSRSPLNSGPSGGPSGGRGGRRGGRGGKKRKNTSDEGSPSDGKKVRRGEGAGDSGECSDASSEALLTFPVPLGPCLNIASSTRTLGDDTPAREANEDNSDFETGLSISALNPPDEDNPDEWRFGPSFSTNKIIFTARAVNLT